MGMLVGDFNDELWVPPGKEKRPWHSQLRIKLKISQGKLEFKLGRGGWEEGTCCLTLSVCCCVSLR